MGIGLNDFFFFFQAEDGIRDKLVTGVQTCALPIWPLPSQRAHERGLVAGRDAGAVAVLAHGVLRLDRRRRATGLVAAYESRLTRSPRPKPPGATVSPSAAAPPVAT